MSLLGLRVSEPTVVAELAAMGIDVRTQHSMIPPGEYRGYIEKPKDGFAVVLTDEAVFLGKGKSTIGGGVPYVSGLFFYAEGKDGYSQYSEELPYGLDFSQDRDSIVAKLGPPSWERKREDGSVVADRWDYKTRRLHLTYSRAPLAPVVVSVQVPDKRL